jgi:type I restriction enzyme M protein
VLADTKDAVLRRQAQLRGRGLEDLDAQLRRVSGFAFYNTSRYDFEKLLADAPHLAANLRNHIAGFSPNMREVLEKFDFDNTISKLDEAGLLFRVLEPFKNVDLHPDKIDNPTMGTIFEELIRKFNEALNENPGEHFTPRDVVHLIIGVGDAVAVEPEEITYPTLLAALPAPRLRAYPRELTIAEKSFAFRSSLFHAYRVAS